MLNKQGGGWPPFFLKTKAAFLNTIQGMRDWNHQKLLGVLFWGLLVYEIGTKSGFLVMFLFSVNLSFFSPASEKRAFLLYYATPLLSRYLPSDHLFFLMLLSGGMFRLLKQSISQQELNEAHTYLKLFTAQAPVFYGKHNTHWGIFGCS